MIDFTLPLLNKDRQVYIYYYNNSPQKTLQRLLSNNRLCADCHRRGPRWASINIGVFLCVNCAGIHRNIGVHITRVKSCVLDIWTSQQVQEFEKKGGNETVNAVYEGLLPQNYTRPKEGKDLEKFIKDKYETKKFYSDLDRNTVKNDTNKKEMIQTEEFIAFTSATETPQVNKDLLNLFDFSETTLTTSLQKKTEFTEFEDLLI